MPRFTLPRRRFLGAAAASVRKSVGFAWGATNYSFGVAARPGPGYFPFGLGIILAVILAYLFKERTL